MKNITLNWKYFIFTILILQFLLLSQLKFTAWPEMLLWPYLILKGWMPYKDIAIAHSPLLLLNLVLFYKLFGVGLIQLKIFTWILVLLIDLVTYSVAKKLWDIKTANLSLLFLIPIQIYYGANGLWFDLSLSFLFPLIFYFSAIKRYTLVGIIWVVAFLTKQTSVFLLLPILLSFEKNKLIKNVEQFLTGVFVIIIPFLFIIWISGILPDYLFWAYKFAGGSLPFSEGQIYLPNMKQFILGYFPLLSFLIIYFVSKSKEYIKIFIWAVFASLGVYPRWELFHILPSTAFIAFLMAILITKINKNAISYYKYLTIFFIGIFVLLTIRLILNNLNKETRFMESDVLKTAEFIKKYTNKNDKIFILNSWEHYYALTGTLPATKPWVPQFEWYLEVPGLEDKMLSDLILNSPNLIVMHPYSESGLDSYKPKKISKYVEKYYYPIETFEGSIVLKRR